MTRHLKTSLVCAALTFGSSAAFAQRAAPVPHLDISQFTGTWYQIARLPDKPEKKCVSDGMVLYAPRRCIPQLSAGSLLQGQERRRTKRQQLRQAGQIRLRPSQGATPADLFHQIPRPRRQPRRRLGPGRHPQPQGPRGSLRAPPRWTPLPAPSWKPPPPPPATPPPSSSQSPTPSPPSAPSKARPPAPGRATPSSKTLPLPDLPLLARPGTSRIVSSSSGFGS